MLDCLEFQSNISRYINFELSFKEKEQFIEHVRTCDECRDELEIYYIIMTSIKQMDEDTDSTGDLHKAFVDNISATEKSLVRRRHERIRRRVLFPAAIGASMIFTGVSIVPEEPEPEIPAYVEEAESEFELRFRFASDERHRTYNPNVTPETTVLLKELLEAK